ncbi:hypothetical protein C6341_g11574 [Phytophthora cactorum]|nr:hypothetical protein C6341_g11574 [Phytophthora cactorum]
MKISTLIGVVAVFLAAAEAKETKETKDSTPAQTPLATMPEAQLDPTIQDTIQEAATPSPEKDAASKEPTIAYDKLTPEAQEALNDDQSFGGVQVPVNDDYFLLNLGKAWPFE